MEYKAVPAEKQDHIKQPRRAAWFEALLDAGMLEMTSRPTLTQKQRDLLEAQGQRFRSRVVGDKTYVWVEDIPSSDLAEDYIPGGEEAADVMDEVMA